jgi:alpha-L-fucosidase 2
VTRSVLTDTAPAACWQDAFPVGNGRHGALVAVAPGGGSVIVTHHHLAWPDAPAPPGPPDLAGRLGRVRDLLLAGESWRAAELFTGDWPRHHPRPFHPAFAVRLEDEPGPAPHLPAGDAVPASYRRALHYRTGIAVTRWPGRRHACYVSRVRDLVVQHASVGGAGGTGGALLDISVSVNSRLPGAPEGLRVSTRALARAPGDALLVTTVRYPRPGAGGYVGITRVVAGPGGHVIVSDGVRVAGCRELTVTTRVEAFSDTAGLAVARGRGLSAVTAAPARDPRLLAAEHARAHAAAFGDVRLDLGVPAAERALSTGDLLARQARQPGRPLPALLEKLFDSGRYLLLSASGLLPPRLTGLWQGDWHPAWSAAITSDANLGLQLAGAVTADVPAAVMAVADHVRDMLADWQQNARQIFGTRGIVAPAHSDGRSGWCTHFEPAYPLQMWTAAADWLLVPLTDAAAAWDDREFLRDRAWPALRELATFYEDFLTPVDGYGHVVFAPSYSPENQPDGWSPAAVNATMDIAAARHALTAAADAAGLADPASTAGPASAAGPGHEAARRWRDLADRLPPYRVSPDGALAEWAWPPAESGLPPLPGNDEHRHASHLYPVWPLHEITAAGTPALAAAALRALRARGAQDDSAHGYLHRALAAARLRDAELAGRLVAAICGRDFFFRSLMSSHYPGRSVYNADAACAFPGVLAEMLADSAPGAIPRIDLLPSVPDFLPAGRARGLRTLAGVLVADLRWDLGTGRAEAVLLSSRGHQADVGFWRVPPRRVTLRPGEPVRLRADGS